MRSAAWNTSSVQTLHPPVGNRESKTFMPYDLTFCLAGVSNTGRLCRVESQNYSSVAPEGRGDADDEKEMECEECRDW